MRLVSAGAVAGLLALATGCGQAGPESLGDLTQPIYEGHESGPADDGVVKVKNVDARGVSNFCTGSLVAPNIVLTARHCVSNLSEGQFTCTDDGELTPDSQGGRFGSLIDPGNLTIYVGAALKEPVAALGAKLFVTETPTICRNDLAVIVLDRELSGVPLIPIRMDRGNSHGELLRVLGFGQTEEATLGVRRAKDGLSIRFVGSSQFLPDGDAIPPRTFLTVGPALCIGDSGGPALTSDGAVTGVYSQLVGACDSPNARQYFTQVAPFADDVLRPAFELTGYEPIAEGSESGQSGAGGSDSGGTDDAGAPSGGGNPTANAGSAGVNKVPPPPGKGGCTCSTTAAPRSDSSTGFSVALAFAALGAATRRRRGRTS